MGTVPSDWSLFMESESFCELRKTRPQVAQMPLSLLRPALLPALPADVAAAVTLDDVFNHVTSNASDMEAIESLNVSQVRFSNQCLIRVRNRSAPWGSTAG
jgi:hypothetical protein